MAAAGEQAEEDEWRRTLLSAAMVSQGALTFDGLWAATIPDAISTVEALSYILEERDRRAEAEARRAAARRGFRG